MSIFDRDYKQQHLNGFDPNVLIGEIQGSYQSFLEAQLIVARELGVDFDILVASANDSFELCEIILMLSAIAGTIKNKIGGYYYLNELFHSEWARIQFNKMRVFIAASGYEIHHINRKHIYNNKIFVVEVSKILPTELAAIFENINEPSLMELTLEFRKAKSIEQKVKCLFAIQKPYYDDLRKAEKLSGEFETLNLKNIKRRTEVFVRHDKEAQDKDMKKYYDGLTDQQKILGLNLLLFDWLHLMQIFKNKEGND